MLLAHFVRAAASRTFWTAGTRSPIRIAIIAITTSSSISVKPRERLQNRGSRKIAASLIDELLAPRKQTTRTITDRPVGKDDAGRGRSRHYGEARSVPLAARK